MNIDERIASLKAVLSGQMEMLRLCLQISSEGSIEYQGELSTARLLVLVGGVCAYLRDVVVDS